MHFDCLTAILSNGSGYVLYYDENRFLASIKQVVLVKLFGFAESCQYDKFAKRLFMLCECLAT